MGHGAARRGTALSDATRKGGARHGTVRHGAQKFKFYFVMFLQTREKTEY